MPKDFHDHLAEKQGYFTPHQAWKVTEDVLDDTEMLIVVRRTKDGRIDFHASAGSNLDVIGMLEVAKITAYDDSQE